MRRTLLSLWVVVCLWTMLPARSYAQAVNATLLGTVTDSTGASAANATGILTFVSSPSSWRFRDETHTAFFVGCCLLVDDAAGKVVRAGGECDSAGQGERLIRRQCCQRNGDRDQCGNRDRV